MIATEFLLCFLLVVGLVLYVAETPVRHPRGRLAAVLLVEGLIFTYVVWRFQHTLPPLAATPAALWSWGFFACEMVAVVYEMWSLGVLSRIADHSAAADNYERRLRGRADLPTVDVLVPSYSEGPEILEATIVGALALDYPPELVRVWILDDGKRPWLEELCQRYRVGYLRRPTNEHGKAGNLNYAYPRVNGEYALVIDADFILQKNFLFRTLGFLLDRPDVALVQTPQHFRNPDPVQHNLGGAKAWTEEQHFFMTVVQSAREGFGNAFCIGSGWLVRRSALDELGGFPQDSICEDLEISYALKGRGLKTLYLNEPLAFGLAPESVPEYLKQRVRWCTGTLQHAFIATGPFRGKNLSALDRLFYLEPILYWFTFPFLVLMLLAPVLFWFTGLPAVHYSGDDALGLLLCRFLASYVIIYWLSEWKVMPPITGVQKTLAALHITAALGKALANPFGQPFKVTAKGQARDRAVVQWSVAWPFLALGAALLAGLAINLTGFHPVVDLAAVTALDIGWSCLTLLILGLCVLACVEQPLGPDYWFDPRREVRQASLVGTAAALLRRVFG